jgi:hypothetical protein
MPAHDIIDPLSEKLVDSIGKNRDNSNLNILDGESIIG